MLIFDGAGYNNLSASLDKGKTMPSTHEADTPPENRGPKLFGRYIAEIPCFKYSFIYGITGGIVGGLGYFMFTSRVRTSSNAGMASFVVTTLSYWMYCRNEWSSNQKNVLMYKEYLKNHYEKEKIDTEPTGPVAV